MLEFEPRRLTGSRDGVAEGRRIVAGEAAVRLVDALDARGSLASLSDALAGPWDLLILDSLGALGALDALNHRREHGRNLCARPLFSLLFLFALFFF